MTTVDSTSDQRTVNNVMRHQYRVLTDTEKAQMQAIKDSGLIRPCGTYERQRREQTKLDRHKAQCLTPR